MSQNKLPSISGDQAMRAFAVAGFVVVRVSSSHHIMKRAGHPLILSVPRHNTLKRGTLRGLIRLSGMSVEEFLQKL